MAQASSQVRVILLGEMPRSVTQNSSRGALHSRGPDVSAGIRFLLYAESSQFRISHTEVRPLPLRRHSLQNQGDVNDIRHKPSMDTPGMATAAGGRVPAACFRWRELSDVDHSACSSSKGVVRLDETLQRLEL
jgi:hypothetical protein